MKARLVSLSAAAALALATVAPASAAVVNDGFTIDPVLEVTGVPASITYTKGGNNLVGGDTSDIESFTVVVNANTDVTSAFTWNTWTGPTAITKNERKVLFHPISGLDLAANVTADTWYGSAGIPTAAVFSGSGPLVDASARVDLRVELPASMAVGSYASSFEVSFSSI